MRQSLTGAHVVRRPDGLHLDAGLRGPLGPELLATPWLLDRFDGLPVEPARVLAQGRTACTAVSNAGC
ncbi:hypothetical protein ACH47Z_42520 [Streptomyces sp. NPDC020192]|uniref:hypothetical protein n=1 Tax=Streptomyces sp. NPDC020192 TaxID=3365066 RepID=UPI0037A5C509